MRAIGTRTMATKPVWSALTLSKQPDYKTHSPEEKSPQSVLKSLGLKKKRLRRLCFTAVKLLPMSPADLRSSRADQCQACSKDLPLYVQPAHACACSSVGKSQLHYLLSHQRRKKCGVLGKRFSDDTQLLRPSTFHWPKALRLRRKKTFLLLLLQFIVETSFPQLSTSSSWCLY